MVFFTIVCGRISIHLPNSMKSETVFSRRNEELQHSSYKISNISSSVSILKHLPCPWIGPPRKTASNCFSRCSPVENQISPLTNSIYISISDILWQAIMYNRLQGKLNSFRFKWSENFILIKLSKRLTKQY